MGKNIAILISGIAPGGAEASIATILPELTKNNKVSIYLLTNIITEIKIPTNSNLSIIRLESKGFFDLKSYIFLAFNLRKYDVIFAHLFWAQIWTGFMAIFSNKIRNKLIWFEHNCYVYRKKSIWILITFLGKFTNKIVSVSPEVADFLYYKSKLNSIIIPNAIEISPVLSCSLPNPETGLNIAFFGRLVPQKRPDIAVLEFKKYLDLQESNINSKLIFIGGGFLETDLKKLLLNSNNFIFKGYLEHNLAISELSRCQVYLNTSDYEGFCIARIEALSLGLCVISRKNAGYLQLKSLFSGEAEMREYGIFFIEDSESIGEILSEIMDYKYWTLDKILRRKQLAQYFSPLNTVSNYLSL